MRVDNASILEQTFNDNEFLLWDRIAIIETTIKKYGEENFYISFSGGKDSVVLSFLVDLAVPNNRIPRVNVNTGMEYSLMDSFIKEQQKRDDRIVRITPVGSFRAMLEANGYPVKSKKFSNFADIRFRRGELEGVHNYLNKKIDGVPKCLRDFFSDEPPFHCSDKCCLIRKERPLIEWQKKNHRPISIVGLVGGEGGRRDIHGGCFVKRGSRNYFYPLRKANPSWVDWVVEKYDLELCPLYNPPYNFKRTGCKGCPFNIELDKDLRTLEEYFPIERRQCEIVWSKVYSLYRARNYRLKREEVKE